MILTWRQEAEARIATAKSGSQQIRFALAEAYAQRHKSMTDPVSKAMYNANFDSFYDDYVRTEVKRILDDAEKETAAK